MLKTKVLKLYNKARYQAKAFTMKIDAKCHGVDINARALALLAIFMNLVVLFFTRR